jgi:flagellar biosynthetic protein FliR
MIVSIAQTQIFILAITRILAILIQIPIFNGSMVPNQVKIAMGVILALVVIPWNPMSADAEAIPLIPFVFAVLQELIIGFLSGFAATLTLGVFQIAGKMMDLSSGFASGQVFNPTLGDTGSALDQFFLMVVMVYFLMINGHHIFLMGLLKTFEVLPLQSNIFALSPERLLVNSAALITSGIQMSLPVVGSLFLADLSLGLLSKVAPQIQVYFLGLPIKIWVGLIALALMFTIIFPVIGDYFKKMGPLMIEILGA